MWTVLKVLVVACVLAIGWQQYQRHQQRRDPAISAAPAERSANLAASGFVPMPPMAGAGPRTVLILAPEDCPEDAGRRADDLTARLRQAGVIVNRTSQIGFSMSDAAPSEVQRVMAVMNGTVPVVVVGRRGKANPSIDEVLAELQAAR